MTTTQDALARAIDSLGAKNLGNGRHAFHAGRYHTATADALIDFERYDTDGSFPSREDAVLRYERDYPDEMTEMPSWWKPEQQFAWRGPVDSLHPTGFYLTAPICRNESDSRYQRITVDLATGEEIAA